MKRQASRLMVFMVAIALSMVVISSNAVAGKPNGLSTILDQPGGATKLQQSFLEKAYIDAEVAYLNAGKAKADAKTEVLLAKQALKDAKTPAEKLKAMGDLRRAAVAYDNLSKKVDDLWTAWLGKYYDLNNFFLNHGASQSQSSDYIEALRQKVQDEWNTQKKTNDPSKAERKLLKPRETDLAKLRARLKEARSANKDANALKALRARLKDEIKAESALTGPFAKVQVRSAKVVKVDTNVLKALRGQMKDGSKNRGNLTGPFVQTQNRSFEFMRVNPNVVKRAEIVRNVPRINAEASIARTNQAQTGPVLNGASARNTSMTVIKTQRVQPQRIQRIMSRPTHR